MASSENKMLANYLKHKIGGKFSVFEYFDEENIKSTDIISLEDTPEIGVSTVASIGLSDTSINLSIEGKPLRTELLMSFYSAQENGAKILSTCVFEIMDGSHRVKPDVVLPRIIELYRPQSSMQHVLLTDPYLWDLDTQHLESKVVAWLIAVPISDAEFTYARRNGVEELKGILEKHSVDVFDLDRSSII
jgi:hypothetical protein